MQCKFCGEFYQNQTEYMRHKKQMHTETVSTCWNYLVGTCEYGDQACWFMHSEPVKSSNMRCKICDKTFSNKPEYHIHRKQHHTALLTPCSNAHNCKYGDELCWFAHGERNQSDNVEETAKDKVEVIQRIFEIIMGFIVGLSPSGLFC